MSILDSEIKTEIGIKDITSNFLAGMGFAKKETSRKSDRLYERIKYGYKICLSMPGWAGAATVNISKVRRTHTKTRYVNCRNYRAETVEQFIDIVNRHSPRETYEHS